MASIHTQAGDMVFYVATLSIRRSSLMLKLVICSVVAWSSAVAIAQDGDRLTQSGQPRPVTLDRPVRHQVPEAASLDKALAEIRKVFADDAAKARAPEAKSKLSRRLVEVATDDSQPADCYALLESAKALAIEAGDADLSIEILATQAAAFVIDEQTARRSILRALAKSTAPTEAGKVVDLLMREAEGLAEGKEFDEALDLVALAQNAARRSKDPGRQKNVTSRLAALRERAKQAEKIEPLLERLASNPADREAATLIGKQRCFIDRDWGTGLPLLAKGDDFQLATLAKIDLAAGANAALRASAGDAWWDYKAANSGTIAAVADERARFHYAACLTELQGLEKARIEQRMQAIEKLSTKRPRPKGLILWLDASAPSSILLGAPRTPQSHGGMGVSRWSDMNGTIHFEHNGSGPMPRLIPKALGGHPAISFKNGSLLRSNFRAARQGTLALVIKPESASANMVPLGCSEEGAGIQFRFYSDGRVSFRVVKKTAEYNLVDSSKKIVMNDGPLIVVATWPDPFAFSANELTGISPSASEIDPSGGLGTVLGARSEEGAYPFDGLIAEVMVFDHLLAPGTIARLRAELLAKWAAPQ
jgi:hypothetical protein